MFQVVPRESIRCLVVRNYGGNDLTRVKEESFQKFPEGSDRGGCFLFERV